MNTTSTDPLQVLVLNGGSSSGKTTLAKQLQLVLPGLWLRLGVDALLEACPPQLLADGGLDLRTDGKVVSGPAFTRVETHWMTGIARIAEAGSPVIVEDNFVSGPPSQTRWRQALTGLSVAWVGVRCSAAEAAARERARGDRTTGMAADQADRVHLGIDYDIEVNTDANPVTENADFIRRRFFADAGM